MIRRPAPPAFAALVAVLALTLAGCTSELGDGGRDQAPAGQLSGDHDSDSGGDPDAPGVEVPGSGDEDENEYASLDPRYLRASSISEVQVQGYSADVDLLTLPSTHAVRSPWEENPKPHKIQDVSEGAEGPAQTVPPTGKAPRLSVDVPGLDYEDWGAGHPPDTSGAVGPDQFVQTVNTSVGVYDKAGHRLNAFTYDTFFSRFDTGTSCDDRNGGDPQVLYDQPSKRWIIADLSYPAGGPYYFCMAVSQGPDLTTGTRWTLYPYLASKQSLADYPKIASGPSGLFVTSNLFLHLQSFIGAGVWAIDRASLGSPRLDVQTVRTSAQYGSLLPANTYASRASGGPEYFVSLENTSHVGVWRFDVDWTHSHRSRFSQAPTLVRVAPYQPAGDIALKDGADADALSDRPMYQAQVAPDGTLWFNHSVDLDGRAGIRWYQLGDLAGTPRVLQQSTFAPSDGQSRWMASLAVDKAGDLAIGYSVGSSSSYPGVGFATRLVSDAKDTLTAQGTIVKGSGSQTGTNRWGDYSQMSLDPDDHCTFWYTQEYFVTTGADWQTRIAAFRVPNCT